MQVVEDLVGQFVLFYVAGADVQYPTAMQVNQVQKIDGRVIISGRQPEKLMDIQNWLGQTDTHIAWDAVTQFHVFADYETFKQQQQGLESGFFGRFKR